MGTSVDKEESSTDSFDSDISDDSDKVNKGVEYVDHENIQYHDYEYCANKTQDFVVAEEDANNIAFRKAEFILNEILADMGIAKAGALEWAKNLLLAALMLQLRMFCHYMGQYVLLKIWGCPVTDVEFSWYKIRL